MDNDKRFSLDGYHGDKFESIVINKKQGKWQYIFDELFTPETPKEDIQKFNKKKNNYV